MGKNLTPVIPHKTRSVADAGPNLKHFILLLDPASSATASCGMTRGGYYA